MALSAMALGESELKETAENLISAWGIMADTEYLVQGYKSCKKMTDDLVNIPRFCGELSSSDRMKWGKKIKMYGL